MGKGERRELWQKMQIIFQDPYSSLELKKVGPDHYASRHLLKEFN